MPRIERMNRAQKRYDVAKLALMIVTTLSSLILLGIAVTLIDEGERSTQRTTTEVNRQLDVIEDRQQRVATCLLEQLIEHRIDSRYHNREEAEQGGYRYPNPDNQLPDPTQIEPNLEACEEFVDYP